jgi:hypothetical protein
MISSFQEVNHHRGIYKLTQEAINWLPELTAVVQSTIHDGVGIVGLKNN